MVIITLINSIVLMACLMLIGYFLRKNNKLNDSAEASFTYILINISMPAMIINTLAIKSSPEKIKMGAILFLIAILFDFILVVLANLTSLKLNDKGKRIILKYSTVILNGGFMGYPIINQMFGAEGMFYATMFHTPNLTFMWTYGESLLMGGKADRNRIKQLILNPNIIAIIIGFIVFFTQLPIPAFVKNLLGLLTNLTTVLSMLIIGSKIYSIGIKNSFLDKDAYYAAFVSLILSPILMLIILKVLNFSQMIEQIYLIYASLPVAALVPVLAKKHGKDDVYASKVVVVMHLISLITIPIFVWVYTLIA